ncbi:tetratricopeptide repeat protein [Sandaracinus amylolyticus]|uniref:tetratricopeptide repeat protein n=1 Tax=Sandaracinus amylolyticus TaxID=927083 RepID=UPI001F41CEEA|nr:tetratricopeptide repeat protein [Sandaracinus amylolyticus]
MSSAPAAAQGARERARTARVEALLAQAERAVSAGRPARALGPLRRAIAADPSDARAPLRLAELLLPDQVDEQVAAPGAAMQRDASEARRVLEAWLAGAPTDPAAQRRASAMRWWAAAIAEGHAVAIDGITRDAGLQDESAASVLRRLAALAIRRDDLEGARRALEAARRAMPQDTEVLAELAALALAQGRATEAVTLFEAVVARRPGDLDALRDVAGARMAAGDAPAAARTLESVARQLPTSGEVRLELARARLEAGDREGGITAAREALELAAPNDAEPAIVLGQALAAAGQRHEARRAFEEALRRRPGSPRATEALRALQNP